MLTTESDTDLFGEHDGSVREYRQLAQTKGSNRGRKPAHNCPHLRIHACNVDVDTGKTKMHLERRFKRHGKRFGALHVGEVNAELRAGGERLNPERGKGRSAEGRDVGRQDVHDGGRGERWVEGRRDDAGGLYTAHTPTQA